MFVKVSITYESRIHLACREAKREKGLNESGSERQKKKLDDYIACKA